MIPGIGDRSIDRASSSSGVEIHEAKNYFARAVIPTSLRNLDEMIEDAHQNNVIASLNFESAFLGVEASLYYV